ncbi:phospholipase D-like domain-containing protein [Clostridium beijerinckii]|uniref:Phospholipase n=1 Tax=Clostridium beijerinckii TaxID=1520 RepID=A0A1S9N5W4_CLOBE|nr:phospholipase D-like domain-containing protein [Clostridium beijerinckii]OOP72850.1 phospholipase [Clostridium beijerinckii]
MWNGSISEALLIETIVSDIEKINDTLDFNLNFKESLIEINKRFPNLSVEEANRLLQVAIGLYNYKNTEKVEIVITAPNSFKLNARKTSAIIKELIFSAEKSITLTGYSISDYAIELFDEIVNKSRQGIYVNFYLNDFENKKEHLDKLLLYKSRYLNIYDYNKNTKDKMAALHAKVVVIDSYKTFISSSNLSYHGIEGNIEMGTVIESFKKAELVEEMLKELKRQKVFEKI